MKIKQSRNKEHKKLNKSEEISKVSTTPSLIPFKVESKMEISTFGCKFDAKKLNKWLK